MDFNGKPCFRENSDAGNPYREGYLNSVKAWIDRNLAASPDRRTAFMPPEAVTRDRESYRRAYLSMIGEPEPYRADKIPALEETFVGEDGFGRIYRLSIEVMDGFRFYGVLALPHGEDRGRPLVIAQHGGGGSPELCSDMIGENNYNHFVKRLLEAGAAVFMPQLLLWNFKRDVGEKFPVGGAEFDKDEINRSLTSLGLSVTGLEVYCIRKSLDCLLARYPFDENKIGMMGLSYGGFYSLYTAAADTRIKAAYDAAAFNDKSAVALHDWLYPGSAQTFSDAEVAALVCPRFLVCDVGKEDPVFDYRPSQPEAERAMAYYREAGVPDHFLYNLWDGGHRFDFSSSGFPRFLRELGLPVLNLPRVSLLR